MNIHFDRRPCHSSHLAISEPVCGRDLGIHKCNACKFWATDILAMDFLAMDVLVKDISAKVKICTSMCSRLRYS